MAIESSVFSLMSATGRPGIPAGAKALSEPKAKGDFGSILSSTTKEESGRLAGEGPEAGVRGSDRPLSGNAYSEDRPERSGPASAAFTGSEDVSEDGIGRKDYIADARAGQTVLQNKEYALIEDEYGFGNEDEGTVQAGAVLPLSVFARQAVEAPSSLSGIQPAGAELPGTEETKGVPAAVTAVTGGTAVTEEAEAGSVALAGVMGEEGEAPLLGNGYDGGVGGAPYLPADLQADWRPTGQATVITEIEETPVASSPEGALPTAALLPEEAEGEPFAELPGAAASGTAAAGGVKAVSPAFDADGQTYRIDLKSVLNGGWAKTAVPGPVEGTEAGPLEAPNGLTGGSVAPKAVVAEEVAGVATGTGEAQENKAAIEAAITEGTQPGVVGQAGLSAPSATVAGQVLFTNKPVTVGTPGGANGVTVAPVELSGVAAAGGVEAGAAQQTATGVVTEDKAGGVQGTAKESGQGGKGEPKDPLPGTAQRGRDNRAEAVPSPVKEAAQSTQAAQIAQTGKEPGSNPDAPVAVKGAEAEAAVVKSATDTGAGTQPGRGAIANGGAGFTGGGFGEPGKDGYRQDGAQDFSALLSKDGRLRNITFTETFGASTGAKAADGVESTIKVYEKFSQAIKLSFLGGGKNVTMRLSPAHLGALQIQLRGDGKNVKAKILVDSTAVKQLLDADSGKLRQLFAEQGMKMEEYTVDIREQSVGTGDKRGTDMWNSRTGDGGDGYKRVVAGQGPTGGNAVIGSVAGSAYGTGRDGGVDLFA